MGLEPMISSARGWQYTMLTYVPGGARAGPLLCL